MNLKKNAMKLGVMLALAVVALTQSRAASAVTRYNVRSGKTATVRNTRNGFVLGTLFSRESVDVRCTVGSYAYGTAYGDADRTGWVLLSRIERPRKSAEPPRCSRPYPVSSLRSFMRRLTGDRHGRTVEKNTITCPDGRQSRCDGNQTHLRNGVMSTTIYFNVRNGTAVKRHSVKIGSGTPIFWRYVTANNGHILVRAVINGESRWGFIPRGDLPPSTELPVDAVCEQPRENREGCRPNQTGDN